MLRFIRRVDRWVPYQSDLRTIDSAPSDVRFPPDRNERRHYRFRDSGDTQHSNDV
jgi:hypothetical protein